MPLHDWSNSAGWDGVHNIWIVELLRWIKPRLPEGYRAYIGSTPALTIDAPAETSAQKPHVALRQWLPEPPASTPPLPASALEDGPLPEPDEEVATLTLDPQTAVYVALHNRLVAAVELVSPRTKDRHSARAFYLARYLGYLREGVHLLLVDVHRLPLQFSFADALAGELQTRRPNLPAPLAISFRVGEPAPQGGRFIAMWRRSLAIGESLPTMPLPLSIDGSILVSLERTYRSAAADAYLP